MLNQNVLSRRSKFGERLSVALATWGLLAFIAIASLSILGLATFSIVEQRSAVIADGRKETANLALSLTQHAELTFRTADALLTGIVERLEHDGDLGPEQLERLKLWFRQEVSQNSQFLSFAVVDSAGSMIVNSAADSTQTQFFDRDYFIYHRTHNDSALHIGRPVHGRAAIEWLIPVTRRVSRPDGSFGGVAVAAVDPRYFQKIYDSLNIGENGAVLLASMDGPLLIRRPFVEADVGRDMSRSGIFKELRKAPRGTAEITASTDGVTRLNSYERGESYPIVVAVAKDMNELLKPWHQFAVRRGIEAISIATVIVLLGIVIWRATRRVKKNSAELTAKNEQFDVALTNMSTGLSLFDSDGKLVVWNDRYVQLYQLPAELIQCGVGIDQILEYRKRTDGSELDVDVYIAELRQSLIDFGVRSAQITIENGRTISVINKATASGGWVGIHEDITDQVRRDQDIFDQATELARTNMRFEAAVGNMAQGLSLFDADQRLVIANGRFRELYQLPEELVRPGTPLRLMSQDNTVRGATKELTLEQQLQSVTMLPTQSVRSPAGRDILIKRNRTADGGWVATHEDVTDLKRQERLIAEKVAELQLVNTRFEAALTSMTKGICLFDADQHLVIANPRFREIYDLPHALVAPGTPLKVIADDLYRKGVRDDHTSENIAEQLPTLVQHRVVIPDGRVISIRRSLMSGGGWVATHEDVTDQQRHERLLAEKAAELELVNSRFDAALSNMTQGISLFDRERRLVVWNARYAEIYGLPRGLLKVGTHVNEVMGNLVVRGILKGENDQFAVDAKIASMNELSADTSRVEEFADGTLILVSRQPTADGGWVATHEDITERRRAEAEITRLARHDVLTGLANRAEFNAKLAEASKRVKRYGGAITVMMLDLDKFKAVNDTLGHPAGDKLLVEVAQRLKSSLRETDVLARLGGDEFAIIQEGGPTQHEGAIALALRIIHSITQPFDLDGCQANVGTSIGIALAPEHGIDPVDLLKRADLALYAVKSGGRNDYRLFQPEMLEAAQSQQTAESELRDAVEREEFELHYQPVMDAKTLRISGAEALIRWRHPTRGLIGPNQFIPLAESTGLIVPLGDWVLQRACADAASWPEHIKVAVNVSAVQFKKGNLFDVILCTLVETGLAPDRLELEITETVLLENQEAHLLSIRQLKNLGISIALDDFGTGYSSMKYLTVFPFDKIKIDKSFTQDALNRRDCKAVIESTLALARGLGTVTTAEGVETQEQLEYMRDAGVNFVQGYLVGRPVPVSHLDIQGMSLAQEMVA